MPETMKPHAIDLAEILRVVSRRKWLLVLPWGIATLAGVAAAMLLKPIYFSSATLVLERPHQLGGALGGMVGGGAGANQQAEIMREQVQSSVFLRNAITASGVKSDPATRAWALKQAKREPGVTDDTAIEAALVEWLRDATTIKRVRNADVFTITVGDYTRARAQSFAQAVANQFVISSKAAQLEAVRATQEFSVEQQQLYKRRLEESQARLEAARRASLASTISGTAVNANNLQHARGLVDQADLEIGAQRQRSASQTSSASVPPAR